MFFFPLDGCGSFVLQVREAARSEEAGIKSRLLVLWIKSGALFSVSAASGPAEVLTKGSVQQLWLPLNNQFVQVGMKRRSDLLTEPQRRNLSSASQTQPLQDVLLISDGTVPSTLREEHDEGDEDILPPEVSPFMGLTTTLMCLARSLELPLRKSEKAVWNVNMHWCCSMLW